VPALEREILTMKNKFIRFFYEQVPPGVMTQRHHARAYADHMRMCTVMVIWPLHWIVQLVHWIGYCWDRHRHRPSWIDVMVCQAVKESEESDARRWIRRQLNR
jgi:hypothetical protein